MKSVLYIHRKAPYSSMATRDEIDAVLATAAFGVETALLFLDDGIFQILGSQQPESAQLKRTAPMFEALAMYDVDTLFVCRQSLQLRGLTPQDLLVPVTVLDSDGIQRLFAHYDHILTF